MLCGRLCTLHCSTVLYHAKSYHPTPVALKTVTHNPAALLLLSATAVRMQWRICHMRKRPRLTCQCDDMSSQATYGRTTTINQV